MKEYDLNLSDIDSNYFHFTKKSNLQSIMDKGLLPKISFHAKFLEETEKVFFVQGLNNLLILFDCWINVCEKYPLVPGMFHLGTKIMRYPWFPKAIINAYFKYTNYNKIHKLVAYHYFDIFLKRYTLLNLDIKEKVDFDFQDIDQIKAKGYDIEYLVQGGYSKKYSDLNSKRMDKWNLHTFSDHGVDSSKVRLCLVNNSYHMKDILNFALIHTTLDVKEVCPILYEYLRKRNYI